MAKSVIKRLLRDKGFGFIFSSSPKPPPFREGGDTGDLYSEVKRLAGKYGVSWSEMLRRILDKGLEKNAKDV